MALRHASGLEKLRAEFDHFQETEDWKVVRQKAGPVEHLLVPGLPRLGASHASLSGSQIHLAPALGQQLNVGGIALVPGGLAAQAYRCCQILEQVLLACGSSLQQLVRLSCHVSHLTSFNSEVLSEAIDLFCHERSCHNITRTIIGCDRLQADAAVQIEGVAVLAPDSRSLQTPPRVAPREQLSSVKTMAPRNRVPRDVAKSGRIFLEDDCEPAAAAAAAATAAVLEEEPELWIMVNDTSENVVPDSLLAPGAESKETSKGSLAPLVPGEVAAVRRDQRRRLKDGFYGRLECFELQELSPAEAESIHQGLGKDFTRFCRMTMKGPEDSRTIRLEPGIIRCHRAEAWHSGRWKPPVGATWSFNFALAVEKTANCFVNVGLVEWLAARQESEGTVSHDESLAEVLKVKSEAEDNVPGGWLPEQHVHENPKQMMLGCRKGVQWFGNAAKVPLFQDNIMEGSLLRFRCDYHLNRQGDIAQVKIWFLPSPVNFEYGGQHTITEADMWFEPLAQWWEPRCQDRKMRSLWVPAVTMYTCEDVVTVAWND